MSKILDALTAHGVPADIVAQVARLIDDAEVLAARRERERQRQRQLRHVTSRDSRKHKQKQQSRHVMSRDMNGDSSLKNLSFFSEDSKKDSTDVALASAWPRAAFEQFYAGYPKKRARLDAERAFEKVRRSGRVTFAGLMAAVERIDRSEPKFIPYPATWLNRGHFLDEAPEARAGPLPAEEVHRMLREEQQRLEGSNGQDNKTEVRRNSSVGAQRSDYRGQLRLAGGMAWGAQKARS